MDAVTLSRLQFAVATYFHFLFVPLRRQVAMSVENEGAYGNVVSVTARSAII